MSDDQLPDDPSDDEIPQIEGEEPLGVPVDDDISVCSGGNRQNLAKLRARLASETKKRKRIETKLCNHHDRYVKNRSIQSDKIHSLETTVTKLTGKVASQKLLLETKDKTRA